jgi:hypothetical protein
MLQAAATGSKVPTKYEKSRTPCGKERFARGNVTNTRLNATCGTDLVQCDERGAELGVPADLQRCPRTSTNNNNTSM